MEGHLTFDEHSNLCAEKAQLQADIMFREYMFNAIMHDKNVIVCPKPLKDDMTPKCASILEGLGYTHVRTDKDIATYKKKKK